MNKKFYIIFSTFQRIFSISSQYKRQVSQIMDSLDNTKTTINQPRNSLQQTKMIFKTDSSEVLQNDQKSLEKILRDMAQVYIDIQPSLINISIQNEIFYGLLQKLQNSKELQIATMNEIITRYLKSQLNTKASQQISDQISLLFDQICSSLLQSRYMSFGLFNLNEIGSMSAIIYTSGQNNFQMTQKVATKIFNEARMKELIEIDLTYDQALDFHFLLMGLNQSEDFLKYQLNLSEKIYQTLKYQKTFDDTDRLPHLFNVIIKAFNTSNEDLKIKLIKIFLLQIERFHEVKVDAVLKKFPKLTDQIQVVSNLTKITLLYVDDQNSFNLVLRLYKTFESSPLDDLTDHNLTILLQISLTLENQTKYQLKKSNRQIFYHKNNDQQNADITFDKSIMFKKIENIIIKEKVSFKVQLSIIYELFFRDKNYNSRAIYPLLFDMNCKEMSIYDIVQFCYCLRKYQKPTTEFIVKFEEAYQELTLRMNQISNQTSIKRLIVLLENQINFFQSNQQLIADKTNQLSQHIIIIREILIQLKSKDIKMIVI